MPEGKLARRSRTPLVDRCMKLETEYDVELYELTKKKEKIEDATPVHLPRDLLVYQCFLEKFLKTKSHPHKKSLYVYQFSKLHFYRFVVLLDKYLLKNSFKFCYAGLSEKKIF